MAAVLVACLAACGPPPTREQRTVFAEPRAAANETPSIGETEAQTPTPPAPAGPQARRVLNHWVAPLRARDLAPLEQSFSQDCALTLWARHDSTEKRTRQGRDALRGWLQGHVLAYPYETVRVVYVGPSAQDAVDMAVLELLDACGTVLLRLEAKLHAQAGLFTAVELRARELPPSPCPH